MESADTFYKVLKVGAIENGNGKVVFAGVKRVALFLIDDEYLCIQNACPHAGGMLGMGEIKGCEVLCPRHSWRFNLKSGACLTDPRYDVRRYQTKIEDGYVWVGMPDKGPFM